MTCVLSFQAMGPFAELICLDSSVDGLDGGTIFGPKDYNYES